MTKNKKAQLKLSFGMIFSIVLIIVFLIFAFYAIKMLLGIQKDVMVKNFYSDLKKHVDGAWNGYSSSTIKTYNLPSNAKFVCFMDPNNVASGNNDFFEELSFYSTEDENLYIYPPKSFVSNAPKKIEHLDLDYIISKENPFCFKVIDGKVKLSIIKNSGENLIKIDKAVN